MFTPSLFFSPAGATLVYPTTDLPPNSFGTREKPGYLDDARLVWDPVPQTDEPQQGLVLLAYFTKVGLYDRETVRGTEVTQLDFAPFK